MTPTVMQLITRRREQLEADLFRRQYLQEIEEPRRAPQTVSDIGVTLGGGLKNILKVLAAATPAEKEFWAKWYHHAQAEVKALAEQYKLPFELSAAAVAALSPGSKWKTNLQSAERLFWLVRKNPGASVEQLFEMARGLKEIAAYNSQLEKPDASIPGGGIASYTDNIKKALHVITTGQTSTIQTRKVWVFFRGLVDPDGVDQEIEDGSIDEKKRKMLNRKTTVDGHAINVWLGFKRPLDSIKKISDELFDRIEKDYQEAARITGYSTRAVQAITWYIWKFTNDPIPPPQLSILVPKAGASKGVSGDEELRRDLNPYEYRRYVELGKQGKLGQEVIHRAERGPSGEWQWHSWAPRYGGKPLSPKLSGPAFDPDAFPQ